MKAMGLHQPSEKRYHLTIGDSHGQNIGSRAFVPISTLSWLHDEKCGIHPDRQVFPFQVLVVSKVFRLLLLNTKSCIIVNGDPPNSCDENGPKLLLIHPYKHFVGYPDYLRSFEIQSDCLAQKWVNHQQLAPKFLQCSSLSFPLQCLNWGQTHPSWCPLFASVTAEWIPNISEEGAPPCPQHFFF